MLSNKFKDSQYKIQSLNDKILDKDEKIEQTTQKVEILHNENTVLKEYNEKLLNKLTII